MYTPAETAGPTSISSEYLKEQTTYKYGSPLMTLG